MVADCNVSAPLHAVRAAPFILEPNMRTLLVADLVTKRPHSSILMTRFAMGMESMQIGDTVQLEHDDTAPLKCISRFWEVGEHGYTLELVLSDARFDTSEARNQYVMMLESKGWMRGYPTEEKFAFAVANAERCSSP